MSHQVIFSVIRWNPKCVHPSEQELCLQSRLISNVRTQSQIYLHTQDIGCLVQKDGTGVANLVSGRQISELPFSLNTKV